MAINRGGGLSSLYVDTETTMESGTSTTTGIAILTGGGQGTAAFVPPIVVKKKRRKLPPLAAQQPAAKGPPVLVTSMGLPGGLLPSGTIVRGCFFEEGRLLPDALIIHILSSLGDLYSMQTLLFQTCKTLARRAREDNSLLLRSCAKEVRHSHGGPSS